MLTLDLKEPRELPITRRNASEILDALHDDSWVRHMEREIYIADLLETFTGTVILLDPEERATDHEILRAIADGASWSLQNAPRWRRGAIRISTAPPRRLRQRCRR